MALLTTVAQNAASQQQAITDLTTQITQLTTSVQTLTTQQSNAAPSNKMRIIEKPTAFDGKGRYNQAHVFRYAFQVWALSRPGQFAEKDPTTRVILRNTQGQELMDGRKMIASILTFMTGAAADWAHPYLEQLSECQNAFNGNYKEFLRAFKLKLESVNAQSEAHVRLRSIEQGKRTFAAFENEFDELATQTTLSEEDKFQRIKSAMSPEYLQRISLFMPIAADLPTLRTYSRYINLQKQDLENTMAGKGKAAPSGASSSHPNQPFRDPNAMDIDTSIAAELDQKIKSAKNRKDVTKEWQKYMKGRCSCCGSKNHSFDKQRHQGVTCNHCSRPKHYTRVCLTRLLDAKGFNKAPACIAAATTVATASIAAAEGSASIIDVSVLEKENASLKDQLATFARRLEQMEKGFQ